MFRLNTNPKTQTQKHKKITKHRHTNHHFQTKKKKNTHKISSHLSLLLSPPFPPQGASASPKADDNLFLWQACIFGPPDTAWDGGVFNLTLIFSDNYPASPPVVKFDTPIFHPNGLWFWWWLIVGCF